MKLKGYFIFCRTYKTEDIDTETKKTQAQQSHYKYEINYKIILGKLRVHIVM